MILNKAYFGQYLHFDAKSLKGHVTLWDSMVTVMWKKIIIDLV